MEKASIIAINRHRINSDGPGIRTLVAMDGCYLNCKYCINPSCRGHSKGTMMSTKEVLDVILQDDLYFMAAGGGVTFGGGEPLLWPAFLKEFIDSYRQETDLCPIIETSLNVPPENIKILADVIGNFTFIVDIKDLNRHIYEKYTGHNILPMLKNLEWLVNNNRYSVKIRVPHIPGYNTDMDVERSKEVLSSVFDDFSIEEFDYLTDAEEFENEHAFEIGKSTCITLKDIRTKIAQANGIEFTPHECHSTKVCSGSCDICDKECEFLRAKLMEKISPLDSKQINLFGIYNFDLSPNKNDRIRKVYNIKHHLDGIVLGNNDLEDWNRRCANERWALNQYLRTQNYNEKD